VTILPSISEERRHPVVVPKEKEKRTLKRGVVGGGGSKVPRRTGRRAGTSVCVSGKKGKEKVEKGGEKKKKIAVR